MKSNCDECKRLWGAYGDAIKEHIRVLGKLQVAVLQYDQQTVAVLRPAVDTADVKRNLLRRAIQDHTAGAHSANDSDLTD